MKQLVPPGLLLALVASLLVMPVSAAPPIDHPHAPQQVLVQFRDGVSDAEQAEALGRVPVQARERMSRQPGRAELALVRLQRGRVEEAVAALSAHPAVAFAEPNWVYTHGATADDPVYTGGSLWGMYGDGTTPKNQYGSQAGEAWLRDNTGAATVYVGVIDEGIDYTHPDLLPNVWTNPHDPVDGMDNDGNGYVDDLRGWDFHSRDASVYDGPGDDHGTHVAGTIGAVGGNGVGVAGVVWQVQMIPAKFLGPNGGYLSDAVLAIDYLVDLKTRHGLNIVALNNSWGGGGYSQALHDAIERANAAGILFVAAAGNGGSDGVGDNNDSAWTPHYPSNYNNTNVIAVAAIDSTGAKARFSNSGRSTVDLGAPGVGVQSTLPGNTYGAYSGTSMATPHVTGSAALYAASHAGATASQIKTAIMDAARATRTSSMRRITVTEGRLNAGGF